MKKKISSGGLSSIDFVNSILEKRGEENLARILRNYTSDVEWVVLSREGLRAKYGNQYVAIRNKEIIESDADLRKLLKKIRERHEGAEDISIDFINSERVKVLV